MIHRTGIGLVCLILAICLAAGCGSPQAGSGETGGAATGGISGTQTASKAPDALTVSKGVLKQAEADSLEVLADAGYKPMLVEGEPDMEIVTQPAAGDALAYERIFVPVDRFPSMLEAVSSQQLRAVWGGDGESPNFKTIYPSTDAMPELEILLGQPGPSVKPQAPDAVDAAVWGDPMSIGIVAFDALTPRLRSLKLDGFSIVDSGLESADWPLASRAWLHPRTELGKQAGVAVANSHPETNRNLAKMTVLAMTGVTAMARNTAVAIENAGDYAFPARIVGPDLARADITTISNEVPFFEGCEADDTLNNMLLCSKPEYFAALELSGVDAVGLTGNHLNDFGYENELASLEMFRELGVPVYGGGANEQEARAPLILEHNGNRLAFLGANQWGPEEYWPNSPSPVSAWAGPENPGAARFDRDRMAADIKAIKPKVDLVFAEVQHTELDAAGEYPIVPLPEEMADFRALRDAGADVVTGVMAHAPQAIELQGAGVILYGLGNLYFDQTWSWPTRTGLVAWHTVYEGRLLNTHLSVTVIDPNFQVRWATPEEQREVLKSVYEASGW